MNYGCLGSMHFLKNNIAAVKNSEVTTKIFPSPNPPPSTSEDFYFNSISLQQKPGEVNLVNEILQMTVWKVSIEGECEVYNLSKLSCLRTHRAPKQKYFKDIKSHEGKSANWVILCRLETPPWVTVESKGIIAGLAPSFKITQCLLLPGQLWSCDMHVCSPMRNQQPTANPASSSR